VTRTAQALGFAGWPTGQVDVAAVHVLAEAIATELATIHPDRIEHTEAKWARFSLWHRNIRNR